MRKLNCKEFWVLVYCWPPPKMLSLASLCTKQWWVTLPALEIKLAKLNQLAGVSTHSGGLKVKPLSGLWLKLNSVDSDRLWVGGISKALGWGRGQCAHLYVSVCVCMCVVSVYVCVYVCTHTMLGRGVFQKVGFSLLTLLSNNSSDLHFCVCEGHTLCLHFLCQWKTMASPKSLSSLWEPIFSPGFLVQSLVCLNRIHCEDSLGPQPCMELTRQKQ